MDVLLSVTSEEPAKVYWVHVLPSVSVNGKFLGKKVHPSWECFLSLPAVCQMWCHSQPWRDFTSVWVQSLFFSFVFDQHKLNIHSVLWQGDSKQINAASFVDQAWSFNISKFYPINFPFPFFFAGHWQVLPSQWWLFWCQGRLFLITYIWRRTAELFPCWNFEVSSLRSCVFL